jgi:hypothetical protein
MFEPVRLPEFTVGVEAAVIAPKSLLFGTSKQLELETVPIAQVAPEQEVPAGGGENPLNVSVSEFADPLTYEPCTNGWSK